MKQYIELTDIIREMRDARKELRDAREALSYYSEQKNEKERVYHIALAQEMLKMRAKNYPAGLIQDVVRGKTGIATKKFEKEAAQDAYRTQEITIRTLETEINLLQSIARYHSDY